MTKKKSDQDVDDSNQAMEAAEGLDAAEAVEASEKADADKKDADEAPASKDALHNN